ncbi:platelet glycoprotein IX [Paralichthys olivaceus]|uniref:platelet glycoprotein IX n=1 Tax=Paralichthys olivaceus TaxID=8255 RepID=UPI00097D87BA|nr:PREDICTED: platelet glycoprotein IX-like [Paralichthys olivaceus]
MPPGLILGAFLLLATSSAHAICRPCLYSVLQSAGLQVNCSSSRLVELPPLPSHTTELHVQDNRLTSVSPGLFDRLVGLKKVSLSGNPFHCDCRIQYLRNWLLKNRAVVSKEPTCASPSSVAQKAITDLTDDYFSSCGLPSCTSGTYNAAMGAMLCCVIALLLWSLKLAKSSTFTLYIINRHVGLEADSLRSLKPKHRRRLHTALSGVSADLNSFSCTQELEGPHVSMELLPQVLDALHKKHKIKIKAT